MLSTRGNRANDERGATAIVMAMSLTVLLGMSALVVDLGAARHAKRTAQNLSDSSSLGAALELGDTEQTPSERMTDAVNEVLRYVQRRQPTPPAGSASWTAAWSACRDSGHLEVTASTLGIAGVTTECISFGGPDPVTSAGTLPTKVRVKVPRERVQPYFTRAIGASDTSVDAASTASIASSSATFQGRLLLPITHGPVTDAPWTRRRFRLRRSSPPPMSRFLVYDDSNLDIWDRSCRQVDAASNAACVMQSPRLVDLFPFSETSLSVPDALKVNMAMGLDHDLGTYPNGAPLSGPPTRVCDLNAAASSAPSPCSTTNVASGNLANHVITAQGRRWRWNCFLIFFCDWEREDLGSLGSLRSAVDQGLVLGTPSAGDESFTVGGTTFCARLARPQISTANYLTPRPGGACTPANPTTQVQVNCGLLCTRTKTINGRHLGYYLTTAARTHFFGAPGGSSTTCTSNPTDPVPTSDNVDSSRWNGTIETRLGWYMSQSDTFTYPCLNPPASPIFDSTIVEDPRFAWIPLVQSDCESGGGWHWGWWNWSFRGGGSNWERRENYCQAGTPKYVQEFRAVFIDTIRIDCCFNTDDHVDEVWAWEFDPALIEPWQTYGPTAAAEPIEYQGGPVLAVLEN